jgi:hypothetical protein
MSTQFDRVFGVRSLSDLVVAFGAEEALDSMGQNLFTRGRVMEPAADVVEWDEFQLHRHLAPVTGRDSPFPLLEHATRINRTSSMAHIKIAKVIPAAKLYHEREPGMLVPNAQGVVDQEARDLVKIVRKTIEYLSWRSLEGSCVVSAATIPGSELTFTITYAVNTYTAAAAWTTAGTKILSVELPALKRDHLQSAGMLLRQVVADGTVIGSIYGNTEVQGFLQNQLGEQFARAGVVMQGPAFDGFELGSLNWASNESGYVPQGGAYTKYISATDRAVGLPADGELRDVLGMALGRGFVPAGPDVAPMAGAAGMVMPAPTRGFYSYAERCTDPAGVKVYVGWVGLPIVLFPAGVTLIDTVP